MPRPSSDDVLSHSIAALRIFKEASSAISAVPVLSAVVGAVLEVVETIEAVKHNKEQCNQLKERVIELGNELKEDFEEYRDALDPSINVQLAQMLSKLDGIKIDIDRLSRKRYVSRWAHQGSIRTMVEKHLQTVEQISHKYVRNILKTLVKTGSQQATYTNDHHRYFRDCDLELGRTRELLVQRDIYSEQRIAEYNGRVVAVRYLHPGRSIENVLERIIGKMPQGRNHNVARYLGRSHPATKQAFIVLETGRVDAAHYFRTPGNVAQKLRCFLQMVIDWEDLLRYINTEGIVVPSGEEIHRHSAACLSSLSVGKQGTFVVSAEDLSQTSPWCLDHHLSTAPNEQDDQVFSDPTSRTIIYDVGSHSMMHILDCGRRPLDLCIEDLYSARLPRIWSTRWAIQGVHANVGDYGYENRQLGRFVRLGNVFDVLGEERLVYWVDAAFVDGMPQTLEDCDVSTEWVWRLVPEPGKWLARARDSLISAVHLEHFWWLYANTIAERHAVSLEELVVVRSVHHCCQVWMDPDVYNTVYFHCLPATSSGEMPSPFGYWSFDAQSSPGPWPDISRPGVELYSWKQVRYSRLSTVQAQLVICFSDCLRAVSPPRQSSESRIIEYTTSSESPRSHGTHQSNIHGGSEEEDKDS